MPLPPPRALIIDLYGAYVRRLGGWLAVADLVALLGHLGHDEQAVRSATSRMKRGDLLRSEARDGVAGYALTGNGAAILAQGDDRIFAANAADLDEGWVVVVFAVPETERDRRHRLRSRLAWLGFGQVGNGVWIAPRRMLPDVKRLLISDGLDRYVTVFEGRDAGFDPTAALIARTWDLGGLARLYVAYIDGHRHLVDRWRGGTMGAGNGDRPRAFVDYTLALSAWRRLPYTDPGLPAAHLPPDWPGHRARQLFAELLELIEPAAFAHVASMVAGEKRFSTQ